ncbi:MAG: UDP-N-acetylmuramate--alanine ligase [Fibrobacteria bacterium]|nr:UDP-N-acetylmuramate--alanine ligase [Fibrobacteria bacterium]
MRWHFAGIGGTGMSAIAFYLLGRGEVVSGSDRLFDRGGGEGIRGALEARGAMIFPQDGSGISEGVRLVVSTAIEEGVPEVQAARRCGCEIVHRSEALASIANSTRTIAVSGTSGKSTVTAMVFRILRGAGQDPSVISGGVLRELSALGHWGNAYGGSGEWLVIEADESDGSLVRYAPEIGLMLNLDRDHKELPELRDLFRTFRDRSRVFVANGDREECLALGDESTRWFGMRRRTHPSLDEFDLASDEVSFRIGGHLCVVPFPGRHMVENALAAIQVCLEAGVPLETCAKSLASFAGVGRRHELVGVRKDVQVFDDFAHNPSKVAAALQAARLVAGTGRIHAIFQPHGFGPLRFLFDDFVEEFARALTPSDRLWIAPVYDAGGSADRSISSADLASALSRRGVAAQAPSRRSEIPALLAREVRPGDVVYSMGARDPELAGFAREVFAALG